MDNRIELLVRVSELYYQQNLNQQEISKIMNISRPTISRLLDEAKTVGVVEIIVHSPISKNPELSNEIRNTFHLREAIVISGEYDYDKALLRCAETAAKFALTVLENNQTLGISWGQAMRDFCQTLKPANYYNVNVVQMVGCLGIGNPRYDGLELALEISKKLGATYSNIYAPVYIDSEIVHSYLMAEPQIDTTIKKSMTADVIVTGVGSFEQSDSTLQNAGYYTEEDRLNMLSRGCVSHILARPLDRNGKEIITKNRYVIAAPLEAMKQASWSVAISASAEKAESIYSVLNGGYINTLIIDEPLAKALLHLKNI